MWNKLKRIFRKDIENEIKEEVKEKVVKYSTLEKIKNIDLSKIPEPIIIDNGSDKTLLIVDDLEESMILYKSDFNKIKNRYNLDINEYNIVKCLGPNAGFIAVKYLLNNNPTASILDITLGSSMLDKTSKYVEIDGVDITILLIKIRL